MAKEDASDPPKEAPATAAATEKSAANVGTASATADPYGSVEEAATSIAAEATGAAEGTNGEEGADGASEALDDDPEDTPSPAASFQAAREVVKKIHSVLDHLAACKQDNDEDFSENARELQQQLIAMRRTHRIMAKANDLGRAAEVTARRKVDTALAHLETRRYESGCLRSAARRCRSFPTPQLDKLRPNLREAAQADEASGEEEEEPPKSDATVSSSLAKRLDAERKERQQLDSELEELEKMKTKELEAIGELQAVNNEIATLLRNGLQGLEPAMNKLAVKSRLADVERADANALKDLPCCLQLVFAKFENVANFSTESGVSVSFESKTKRSEDEPPAKKARTSEAGGDSEASICVKISANACGKASASKPTISMRFTCPGDAIIHVSPVASGTEADAILDNLWPEDDGRKTTEPSGCGERPGRAYYWAQVLGGLRETVSTSTASLAAIEAVSAMDVITRVQTRLAAKGS